jgi:hypothetical protein
MLRLRRAELAAQISAGHTRLCQVEARLCAIESEGREPMADVQIQPLPAVRLAGLTVGYAARQPVVRGR